MRILKAVLVLATLCAVVGMVIITIQCPPLGFFAVPACVMLLAVAAGV
jgi:hypothetical protein